MNRYVMVVAFLALALPVSRADEKDAKQLEGSYEVVSVLVGGKTDKEKKDEVSKFTIKEGMITTTVGKKDDTVKFTVDATKKPAHLDVLPGGDEKLLAIYETKETEKGLELTIAFTDVPKGGERPKDFKGEGKGDIVIRLLRKKAK